MNRANPLTRISLGLTGLMTSLALLGATLGVFPDEGRAVVDHRRAICETLGVTFSTLATQVGHRRVEQALEEILRRAPEIQSIGVRLPSGKLLLDVGDHAAHWKSQRDAFEQMNVPVYDPAGPFADIEVRFRAGRRASVAGMVITPEMKFAIYLGISSFAVFFLYLRHVLHQLNPSRAIPHRVREALDTLAEGLLIVDPKERIVLANAALQKVMGCDESELIGKPANGIPLLPHETEDAGSVQPWRDVLKQGKEIRGRLVGFSLPAGDQITFSVSCSPIFDDEGNRRGAIASFEDVTLLEAQKTELRGVVQQLHASSAEIQRQNEELEVLATRDPLTGCLNRRSFFKAFDEQWRAYENEGKVLAAIMVDVDHFKSINDRFGHAVGDEVLQVVGNTLRESVRADDLVCRYGGEEFTVLLPQTAIEQARSIAEHIRQQLAAAEHPMLSITASLGVSATNQHIGSTKELLELADQCLYLAKRNGRDQVVSMDQVQAEFYSDENGAGEDTLNAIHGLLNLCDSPSNRSEKSPEHQV